MNNKKSKKSALQCAILKFVESQFDSPFAKL